MRIKYTKKQIQEAIKYWKNQLRRMDEAADGDFDDSLDTLFSTNMGLTPEERDQQLFEFRSRRIDMQEKFREHGEEYGLTAGELADQIDQSIEFERHPPEFIQRPESFYQDFYRANMHVGPRFEIGSASPGSHLGDVRCVETVGGELVLTLTRAKTQVGDAHKRGPADDAMSTEDVIKVLRKYADMPVCAMEDVVDPISRRLGRRGKRYDISHAEIGLRSGVWLRPME